MTTYQTMTAGGSRGSDIEAFSDEEAEAEATKQGYEVLDIQDSMSGQPILVIAE